MASQWSIIKLTRVDVQSKYIRIVFKMFLGAFYINFYISVSRTVRTPKPWYGTGSIIRKIREKTNTTFLILS